MAGLAVVGGVILSGVALLSLSPTPRPTDLPLSVPVTVTPQPGLETELVSVLSARGAAAALVRLEELAQSNTVVHNRAPFLARRLGRFVLDAHDGDVSSALAACTGPREGDCRAGVEDARDGRPTP